MKHFCTLFDRNYLIKGLIMQRSLARHMNEPYLLHILAMDAETEIELRERNLDNVNVIPAHKVENALSLGIVRLERTWQEYCWTMASQLMQFLLPVVRPHGYLTYLDADLMFFSDPQPIFDEMGDKSIAIIPHRHTAQNKARLDKNGKFNVSWVTVRGDDIGCRCVMRWAEQCRQWCYYRNEGDKFGDQKYLDEWPKIYAGHVCEIENIGAGLAPWNLPNYEIIKPEPNLGPVVVGDDPYPKWLIFYHLHEFESPNHLTNYPLRPEDREFIYKPYLNEWHELTLQRISA